MQKSRRLGVIRVDAANLGRRNEYKFRLCIRKKFLNGGRVQQIDFLPRSPDEILKSLPLKFAPDGAAHQSAMAGHVNAGVRVHHLALILSESRFAGINKLRSLQNCVAATPSSRGKNPGYHGRLGRRLPPASDEASLLHRLRHRFAAVSK